MATHNVPNVNTSVLNSTSTQTTKEVLEENEREEKRRTQQKRVETRDSIEVVRKKLGVAGAAEASPPVVKTATAHEKIKTAQSELKKAFVEAGGKAGGKTEENLATASEDELEKIQNEIDRWVEEGVPEDQVELLKAKRDALVAALDEYHIVHAGESNVDVHVHVHENVNVNVNVNVNENEEAPLTIDEQNQWRILDDDLRALGLDRGGETNVEGVQKKFMLKLGSEVAGLQTREKGLVEKFKELQARWKSAPQPKEKAEIEKSLAEIKSALTQINQRKLDLQKLVTNFATTSDTLLGYQVSKELGLKTEPQKPVSTKSAKVKSASVSPSETKATGASAPAAGGPALSTQSVGPAGGGESAAESISTPEGSGPSLHTASEGDSYVSPDVVLARTAATDFTGTTMSIASTGNNQRAEAKRLDKLIKKLILAAQSGNMDAVVSGLIFLGKRQNILTTSMGAQALKAMQFYEKQLSVISRQMGELKPSPDYSSKLAKLNADMNIYSSSRQMITQTFRDFLSAKEQIDELTHSVITVDGRIKVSGARFQ